MTEKLPPLGLWIDCPPKRVLKPEYWDQLQMLGVTTAAVMVETSRLKWDPYWSASELEAIGQMVIERDMELVLTTWPVPRQRDIDAMCDAMQVMLLCGASGCEIDIEGQWKRSRLRDFHSLEEAEAYLMRRMDRVAVQNDVRIELTTHTGHRECTPHARLVPRVDRFFPQLYSCRHRPGGKVVNWDDRLGPGRLQRWGLNRVQKIPDLPYLCVGLPAWDQRWPGHDKEEAMQVALDAALRYEPEEVRYWSSKWVLRDTVIAAFLAQRWGRNG